MAWSIQENSEADARRLQECSRAVSYTHLDVYKRQIGKGAGTQLAGALSSTSGSVNKSASIVAQGVTKTVTSANLPNNMLTAGKQTGQSLANGLQSQSGLVRSAADVLISSARNGVAQLSQAGHDAGVQFSNGLAAGIRLSLIHI